MNTTQIQTSLSAGVDELGFLLAQIAELEEKADLIKSALKASGETSIDGDLYHASISTSTRQSLDRKSVEKYLTPEILDLCLKSTAVCTLKVGARIAKAA